MKRLPALVPLALLVALPFAGGADAPTAPTPPAPAKPTTASAAAPVTALQPGEAFTFRVGWGMFSGAGEIKVTADTPAAAPQPQTRVLTQTRTAGTIGFLYPFTGEATALFDPLDGRMLSAVAETKAGSKATKMSIVFDYPRAQASYTDPIRPARSATLSLPAGRPLDLITVLIQARAWQLKAGESHDALVLFDKDFYPLKITAQKVEKISTPKGKRDAMLLVPTLDGPPKGMFAKGGAVKVWISADTDRLPLQFEVKVKVGTATATLTDYTPPGGKPANEPEKKPSTVTPRQRE
jgi:hypothetical protein